MPNTEPDNNVAESAHRLHVAVGVLVDASGRVLIQQRAVDAHQGGLWEFPGGKVESGETVLQALARELKEELGINIDCNSARPLARIEHDYGDRHVLLDTWRVEHWAGEPVGIEGQPIAWYAPSALDDFALPEANRTIIARLL